MKHVPLLAAAAAALLLASPALAGTMTPAQTCTALETQFNQSITGKETMPKAESAKKLAATGTAACKAGKPKTGAADIRQALEKIGVKPSS